MHGKIMKRTALGRNNWPLKLFKKKKVSWCLISSRK